MSNEAFVFYSEGGGDPPDSIGKQLFLYRVGQVGVGEVLRGKV